MKTQLIIALKIFLVLTVITGLLYPLFITVISQGLFHGKANGSLIRLNGVIIGSELIGQPFDSTAYFWSRPSAIGYNPLPSSGSNFGPTSDKLKKLVDERRSLFASANGVQDSIKIPVEMITASGSGLDPHISPEAAFLQVDRVAKARNYSAEQKQRLIECIHRLSESPQFLCFGNKRINVLLLNLEVDKIE
jgi:potassium-transporting ATPase KdpC subunit